MARLCSLILALSSLLLQLLMAQSGAVPQQNVPSYIYHIFPGPAPEFRVTPCDQIAVAGDESVTFHCLPAGAPDVRVEWKIFSPDGEAIVGDRHEVSKDGTRLKIRDPTEYYNDFLVECCLVSPFLQEPLKASAKLFVRAPEHPKIVVAPRSGKYRAGSRVVLECAGHGWPLPKISWVFTPKRHGPKQFFEADREYRDFIKEANRLIILNMNPNTEGTFTCVAYNRIGNDKAKAHAGFDRRSARRHNVPHIVTDLRDVYRTLSHYSHSNEQRNQHKATCTMEALNQFGYLDVSTRHLDGTTMAYDHVIARLEQQKHEDVHSLPGEALNIDLELLRYIKNSLNCSSNAVPEPDCRVFADYLVRYASLDGSCNNFRHPSWGQVGRGYVRCLQSQYEGGLNLPQGAQPHRRYGGFPKPSARVVSLHVLLKKHYKVDHAITQMLTFFGQFIDHDMQQTPGASTDRGLLYNADCNKHCRMDLPCFPIIAPKDDPRVKGCLTFKRSAAFCASGEFSDHKGCIRPREQVNQLTSYIDASVVYSTSCRVLNLLRDSSAPGFYLKTGPPAPGQILRLLPTGIVGVPTACGRNSDSPNTPCYNTGEVRGNEFIMLTVQHTMMVREHNRIAYELHRMNPQWCAEKVFYETRRIVAAILQQITYNEYLPALLGNTGMRRLVGPYKGYKPDVNPSVSNEFATAAFRVAGHVQVPDYLAQLDPHYRLQKVLPMKSTMFAPKVVAEGGIDSLVRGAITVAMKEPGSMSNSMINQLFEKTSTVAGDLGSLNTQRGRDHGQASYNHWRSMCGLKFATEWEHFSTEIRDPQAIEKLKEVYGHPCNVDLFPGLVLENRVDDSLLGPTARCIVANQFKRTRDGDRHWFENAGQFSDAQVQEIRQYTLSRLICNTVESINRIQPLAFFIPGQVSDLLPCSDLPDMDLSAWKDMNHGHSCMPNFPCATQGASAAPASEAGRQWQK